MKVGVPKPFCLQWACRRGDWTDEVSSAECWNWFRAWLSVGHVGACADGGTVDILPISSAHRPKNCPSDAIPATAKFFGSTRATVTSRNITIIYKRPRRPWNISNSQIRQICPTTDPARIFRKFLKIFQLQFSTNIPRMCKQLPSERILTIK